jgi:hypothetical protein
MIICDVIDTNKTMRKSSVLHIFLCIFVTPRREIRMSFQSRYINQVLQTWYEQLYIKAILLAKRNKSHASKKKTLLLL